MGLDTSHDCFHGAYSSFARWRHMIAEVAGYVIWKVEMDFGLQDTIMLDWGHTSELNFMGEWEKSPDDPLLVLFCHSDCEGVIAPEEGKLLADALENLLPNINALEDQGGGHILKRGGYSEVTQKFIAGLREAASKNEDVEFY